ncbi:hypothetical protein OAV47_00600 [bacterium]|nr:hypothetical protein [bacterium]
MHRALPVLLALAAGLWALLAPTPRPAGAAEASAPLADRWDLGWARGPWGGGATDGPPRRVLVYVRADNAPCLALERAAGADAGMARAAAPFKAIVLEPEADGEDARLAEALGIHTAPRLLVLEPASWRQLVGGTAIAADLSIRPVRAITGGHLEPIGVAWELERASTESPASWPQARSPAPGADPVLAAEWLEAAGALAEAEAFLAEGLAGERSPNGVFHRMARLRAAVRSHTVSGAADSEGTIEAALLMESDPRLLFRGWSLLASVFERRALAAAEAGGTYRGVEARRWDRRARETSRLAWMDCPDEAALPFGALLLERYGARPADLDSLDRAFCGAVLRTLAGLGGDDHPRVQRAAAVVATLR